MATVAASLDRCSVPGRTKQEGLPLDQLEFGMGIHNEPGVKREEISSLETTVKKTLDMMFRPKEHMWQPKKGQRVALMVNNLGGLSVLELGVVADEVVKQLVEKDVRIERSLIGTFVTSLDGPGFSVTLLSLDDELMKLLDAPTTAPAWPRSIHGWATDAESVTNRETTVMPPNVIDRKTGVKGKSIVAIRFRQKLIIGQYQHLSSKSSLSLFFERQQETSPESRNTTHLLVMVTAERHF
jgi:dihydroxyacetone kinase